MSADYTSNLQSIFSNISPESSESDVEKKVIVPLLQMLGYSPKDWEPQAAVGKSKLDFLVLPPTSEIPYAPYLVIEVKAPSKNLAQNIWQINDYMRKTVAFIGLLTNGYEFRIIYNYELKPKEILNYSQKEFIDNFESLNKLLSKPTCLTIYKTIYQNEQNFRSKFLEQISKLFKDEKNIANVSESYSSEKNSPLTIEKEKDKSMIITIFNNKGGVGKTTTTINLAAALSKLGKRVLLIDVDAQANLTTGLGIDPLEDIEDQGKKDITDLLLDPRTKLEDVVIHKQWDDVELDIVPSHIRLSDMEAALIMTPDVDRVLSKKLRKYNEKYDYVLIDPPPSFGKANTISLMASSAVFIPTQLTPYPVRALEYVINRAIAVDESRDDSLHILGIAVSMYDRSASKNITAMTQKILEIIAKKGEGKDLELFPRHTWIPRLTIVANASDTDKAYPLCYAEFDKSLSSKEKEAAQDAFNCYIELGKYLISTVDKKRSK
ncbi:cobyrinic acid a,c-diamide synthase [Calothrix sp. PCC 7716]|nr:cobyrinic acid a,c-diamide synthase [Calothrix sp. PCC 7716]